MTAYAPIFDVIVAKAHRNTGLGRIAERGVQ